MQKRERQRGDRKQRPNPKRHLHDHASGDGSCAGEDGTMFDEFRDIEQVKKCQQTDYIADHAMIELECERIFKKIPPQRHVE